MKIFFSTPSKKIAIAIVALWIFIVYAPILGNGFCLDDVIVRTAEYPKTWSNSVSLLYTPVAYRLVTYYRPLTFFSFVVDYNLWGDNPAGYHLTNIILAIVVAVLVLLLLWRLLPPKIALGSTLLFAVLPGHSEAIIAIFNRSQIISALGIFLALLAIVQLQESRTFNRGWMLTGAAAVFLGCMAKESALTAPLLSLLVLCWLRPARSNYLTLLGALLLQGVACLAYMALRYHVIGTLAWPNVDSFVAGKTLIIRYVNSAWIFSHYIRLTLFPWPLSCDYPLRAVDFHWLAPVYPCCLLAALYYLWRGNLGQRICSFGALWFTCALLPALHIVRLQIPLAERLLYPASLGMAIVIVYLAVTGLKHYKICLILLLLLMSTITYRRCYDWRDNDTLWSKTLQTTPQSYRAHIFFGTKYASERKWQTAMEYYKKALQLKPNRNNRVLIYHNMAVVWARLGDKRKATMFWRLKQKEKNF